MADQKELQRVYREREAVKRQLLENLVITPILDRGEDVVFEVSIEADAGTEAMLRKLADKDGLSFAEFLRRAARDKMAQG